MPQSVAPAAAMAPIIRLVASAPDSAELPTRVRYQSSVKPLSGNAAWIELLKENSGISDTGRYRKTR